MNNKTLGFALIILFAAVGNAVGQVTPGKLTRQEITRPNPLRADQPVPIPGGIQQTSLQSEDALPPLSMPDWGDFPATMPGATLPDTGGFNTSPNSESNMSFETAESAFESATPSSLNHADPFGPLQSEAAVPANAIPTPQVVEPQPSIATAQMMTTQSRVDMNNEGTGLPGSSLLEGLQTPHLTIQKVLPEEIVIDQPATLKTVIQNVGNSVAKNVMITDRVPQGTRLLSTIPEAIVSPDGELRWSVGNLDPNVQLVIEMKVLPLREGEIGSVATVSYTGEASARISVTRPMLKVEVNAPAEVKFGETANIEIIVSNPGTATVTNVRLENHVPEGFYHAIGRVIQNDQISTLKPKEVRKLTLPLLCTGSGNLVNHVVVTADGNLTAEDKTTIRALAPILELEISGARTRFLERSSDYRLIVANKGNASAHDIALELALPAAVQFVSTNQSGVYEASTHSVHWALAELPAHEAGEIELVVIPLQKGEHTLRFTGTGENNLLAEASLPISIDGIPAITFDIVGDSNLVEVGKEVQYEIRVANRGTKAAENVRVRVTLAEGMSFIKAEGGRYQAAQGGIIQFETIPQLAARGENVYKLSIRCMLEGDHRLNVQIISDDLRSPITKEESTRVFK